MRRILILAFIAVLAGCSKQSGPPERPPAPVKVASVSQKDVPVQVKVIGNVVPVNSVGIKSMVNGEIDKVVFQEGQDVKAHEVLLEIDSRPYREALAQWTNTVARDEAIVNQAEANITRDAANAKNAKLDADRYADLFRQGVVSQQQRDQTRTTYDAQEAQVKADQAALENARAALKADRAMLERAKVDLSYCTIAAPMDGRTGALLLQKGNVIKANDVPIVVINQIQPIYVNFAVPERYLTDIKARKAAGRLAVQAQIPEQAQTEDGELTFVDNAVDTSTGTIRLRATFQNPQRHLWPGQFVNVVLTLGSRKDAVVVPSEAVQTGQQGPFVFVIKPDQTAQARKVVPGPTVAGDTVIETGVKPGEQVVTDGHLGLIDGSKVTVKNEGQSRPGATP